GPRVVIFALDGVGADEFRDAVRGGRAPLIAALLGPVTDSAAGTHAHAYAARGVLSVLPSTTIAAWTSLFTGEPPARTGVPGNEWFERQSRTFYAPAPVTVEDKDHALEVYSDDLMGRVIHVPTLYDLADRRAYVSFSQVQRGADLLAMPSPGAFGDLVAAAVKGATEEDTTLERKVYAELDINAAESVVEQLEERGLPDLLTVYFPGVDLFTHLAPNALEAQRAYLRDVVDSAVAEVLAPYRRLGALDSTWILFVADHGHTPTLGDDRHSLGSDEEDADEPPALLRRLGFRVRPRVLDPADDEDDFQAALAYQGAFAYVYLADRSTCADEGAICEWSRPPRLREDVLPVVRAFDAANRTGAGNPGLRGTLDLIFVRTGDTTGRTPPVLVWDGRRLVGVREYLRRHPRPDLVRLEERLRGLVDGPYGDHAGDVLLLARNGIDRPIDQRYYFSSEYRSWHGSPSRQDSEIPLVVARADRTGEAIRAEVERAVGRTPDQLDVTPLVRALLEAP
ncbi:MAG TPA: alkaline phosphatase family protein, partial [Gemmatimonadales bacterium]|nr:alkaline phosphatase family protein [Gemmatimonadales bacterium]